MDYAYLTNPGGRDKNEDYVTYAEFGSDKCFVLCDGLGGHECGDVASMSVAEFIAGMFSGTGDYPTFLDDAFNMAQTMLLNLQVENNKQNAMKTTLVVLVVTDTIAKWAHIGDSRLYHIYNDGNKVQRTRDHSMVQLLLDQGEITEAELGSHPDRNKLLRALGGEWGSKTFDKSPVLELDDNGHEFLLATDGFWEYINEEELLKTQKNATDCKQWLSELEKIVVAKADMSKTDNYSAICVRI